MRNIDHQHSMIILCNTGGGFHQKRQERWSVSIDGIRIVDLIKQINKHPSNDCTSNRNLYGESIEL